MNDLRKQIQHNPKGQRKTNTPTNNQIPQPRSKTTNKIRDKNRRKHWVVRQYLPEKIPHEEYIGYLFKISIHYN